MDVYWWGSSATLGTNFLWQGIMLAHTRYTLNDYSHSYGRALREMPPVTMGDGVVVTLVEGHAKPEIGENPKSTPLQLLAFPAAKAL
jgi:hypothetical protein